MKKLLMFGRQSCVAWNLTKGWISSAWKLTYLHVPFLLHNTVVYHVWELPLNKVTANAELVRIFSSKESENYTYSLSMKVYTVSPSIFSLKLCGRVGSTLLGRVSAWYLATRCFWCNFSLHLCLYGFFQFLNSGHCLGHSWLLGSLHGCKQLLSMYSLFQ